MTNDQALMSNEISMIQCSNGTLGFEPFGITLLKLC